MIEKKIEKKMAASVGGRYDILHSAVPGRLRLSVPGLKNDESLARHLERRLRAKPNIQHAAASTATGCLIVTYHQSLGVVDVVCMIDEAINAPHHAAGDDPCWWSDRVETVLQRLDASAEGLTADELIQRKKRYGSNAVSMATSGSELDILLRQFNSLPVWLLGTSALISVASGGLVDAALIGGVVMTNAAIGFFTERRAERILQSFSNHEQCRVMVRRDRALTEVSAEELVPGDIIFLMPGVIIAADARIIACADLQVDESMLTGESLPVSKTRRALPESVALADRLNMLYAGTVVVAGSGAGVVVAIGDNTEAGRINTLVAATKPNQTPMQRQLNRIGQQLTFASIAASGLVFGLGILRGVPLAALIRTTTALAVAAIPEGLPTVATSILATGLREMQRNKVLIRQLAAVETLGAVSVICFDKTGTLTQNRMTAVAVSTLDADLAIRDGAFIRLEQAIPAEGSALPTDPCASLHDLLLVAALCNDSEVQINVRSARHVLNGSSTENALLLAAISGGIDIAETRRDYPLLKRTPRSDGRRYMITVHETEHDQLFIAAKGNPLDLLELCTHWQSADGQITGLTEANHQQIVAANTRMAAQGLRVLGFARAEQTYDQALPFDFVWLGMIGLADPVRPGISGVLREFHDAGIRTVMVTGDQVGTAEAVAHEVQLAPTVRSCPVSQLALEQIAAQADQYDVFARVSPADKLDIVQALQQTGLTVAMTGDGTNDAPALRAADIGVAMGHRGTDAAREIADVVLAEDDLGTMVVAVRQGRTIYANMRKAIHFLISTNSSEVFVTIGAAACGLGQPLNAGQLLWLNLVTDVAIAYSLGFESAEYDVMQRPPRPRDEHIIGPGDVSRLALKSGLFSISALTTHLYGMTRYGAQGGGIAFSTLIASQVLDGLSSRSETRPPWALPQNRAMTLSILSTAALQGLVTMLPTTRRLLGLAAFDLLDLAVIGVGSLWPFLVVETMLKPNRASPLLPPPA